MAKLTLSEPQKRVLRRMRDECIRINLVWYSHGGWSAFYRPGDRNVKPTTVRSLREKGCIRLASLPGMNWRAGEGAYEITKAGLGAIENG